MNFTIQLCTMIIKFKCKRHVKVFKRNYQHENKKKTT